MTSVFIELVKKGKVRHPTQKGFNLSAWEMEFKKSGDNTFNGASLFEAGKWIFQGLETVRESLSEVDLNHFDKDKALRMLVADLNIIIKTLSETQWQPSFDDDTVFAQQIVQYKLDNELGAPIDPDSILGTSTDGARFPIGDISVNGGKTPHKKLTDKEALRRVKMQTLLGQYYDIIENIWLKFLWHGWEIVDKDDYYLLLPTRDEWAKNRAISDYRLHSLMLEVTGHIVRMWCHRLSRGQKENLSRRPIITIKGSGKEKTYKVKIATEVEDLPPSILLHETLAAENYYTGIVQEILPVLSISLHRLLKAWGLLHALAKAHADRFPQRTDISKVQTLLQYAPTIDRNDLVDIFKQYRCFSLNEINAIIDFLTFKPSPHNEIWDAPLIKIDKSKYTIAIGPLLHGNLIRVMEKFMVRGSLDIAGKGLAFEEDCRNKIGEAISENKMFSSSGIWSKQYVLRTSDNEEEIDILLWIGNKLFLGEAKCLLFPADRMDFYNYYDTIEHAVSQAERKAEFANKNRKQVIRDLSLPAGAEDEIIKPFVIVNFAFGAGFTYRNVPITDSYILTLFLQQSEVEHFVSFSAKSGEKTTGSVTRLYTTEEEASEIFTSYLGNPPQVEMYKKFLKVEFRPIPAINKDEKPFAIACYEVKLPLPDLGPGGKKERTKTTIEQMP